MSDFESELERRFSEIAVPEETGDLRRAAVSRAMGARARARARRRTGAIVCALVLSIAGGAFAYTAITGEDGRVAFPGRPEAPARRAANPYLQGLPWLWQPAGTTNITDAPAGAASVEFPAGVGYQEAADALLGSVSRDGELPANAVVRPPLPPGVVLEHTGRGTLRLSLAAPFGYNPTSGAVTGVSVSLPGSLAPEEAMAVIDVLARGDFVGTRLPDGVHVDLPTLADCQVRDAGEPAGEVCPAVRSAGP